MSDAYDLSDATSANTKTSPAFKTEHNTKLSDISDLMVTDTKKMAYMTMDEQNPKPSDVSEHMTRPQTYSLTEKEPHNIFRLGRSDTWACQNCRQKGDVHYMR
ncbi:MAG: hypothetical protein ACTHKP_14115 [Nitrososphaeraceae archaeon]